MTRTAAYDCVAWVCAFGANICIVLTMYGFAAQLAIIALVFGMKSSAYVRDMRDL